MAVMVDTQAVDLEVLQVLDPGLTESVVKQGMEENQAFLKLMLEAQVLDLKTQLPRHPPLIAPQDPPAMVRIWE